MFKEQRELSVDLSAYRPQHVFVSKNKTKLAFDESSTAEACKAWCFVLEDVNEDRFQVCVGLFFLESQALKVFALESNFEPQKTPENLVLAEAFAGDMGFFLEDLRYSSSSTKDQAEIRRLTPFFYPSLEAYLQALSDEERSSLMENFETTQIRAQSAEKYEHFVEQYVTILSML